MKHLRCVVLVFMITLSKINSMPTESPTTTTARSTTTTSTTRTHIGDTIKQLTNQLMEINATSADVITLDTRTPPKIKQHAKKRPNKPIQEHVMENSHAGVAIPVDEEAINLEETTKKLSFYKIERPTTNSGLSTWILLSGHQTGSTTKPPKKQSLNVKTGDTKNVTVIAQTPNRNKPIFKKRVTTTTTTRKPTTIEVNTTKNPVKLTKIKASVLNNAKKGHQNNTATTTMRTTTKKLPSTTTTMMTTTIETIINKNITNLDNNNITIAIDSNKLPLEAKDGEVDLITTDDDNNKKTRRPTNKRKKNKNKRRRPTANDKTNSNATTKIEKHHNKNKEKPIGTQLYNYLSREVMPTVGVGLVGLMVTAGLASYFLYPFGVARRSYEIDRKDKDSSYYYYNDDYSGGIAEEEAIGKVIAGMPANTFGASKYTSKPTVNRNSYGNVRNRQVDHRISSDQQISYQPNYNTPDVIEQSKETGYTVDDRKFVVGSVPKDLGEEVTPAVVPEHGPRNLNLRKRRDIVATTVTTTLLSRTDDDKENEINSNFDTTTATMSYELENITTTATPPPDKVANLFSLMRDLFHLKINLGLQLIQNATQSVSRYVSKVQKRLDEHYRNYSKMGQ